MSGNRKIRRNDIWLADLGQHEGSLEGGVRPVLIIQNNTGNKHSTTTIVAPISSQNKKIKKGLPTHLRIPTLNFDSHIQFEQITTINVDSLIRKLETLPKAMAKAVDRTIMLSLGVEVEIEKPSTDIKFHPLNELDRILKDLSRNLDK